MNNATPPQLMTLSLGGKLSVAHKKKKKRDIERHTLLGKYTAWSLNAQSGYSEDTNPTNQNILESLFPWLHTN